MRGAGLVRDGRSCKDIGTRMAISPKTVQTYHARIMDKLQLTNTPELIRYAIEQKADTTMPVPAQPTPPPVIMRTVVSPMMPALVPIVSGAHRHEREEWPG